jgi:antitoxin MazE
MMRGKGLRTVKRGTEKINQWRLLLDLRISRMEVAMVVTQQKWGDSVGVRLPKTMLAQVGLNEGSRVEVMVEGDHLAIRCQRLKLADLLAACKPENRPYPIDFDPRTVASLSSGNR